MNEFICTDGTRLPIELRFSTKAKRWKLQLEFTGRLEVVIPQHEERRLMRRRSKGTDIGHGVDNKGSGCAVVGNDDGRPGGGNGGPGGGAGPGDGGGPGGGDGPGGGGNLGGDSDDPITSFIESHRRWIERAAQRTQIQRETYREGLAAGLPTHLDFPLCNELWLVEYQPTQAHVITTKADGLRRIDGTRQVFALKLSGAVADEGLCRRALIRFVTKRAKEVIPPFARETCLSIGAAPNSITVNNRKSAWGVCTRSKDIRIDRKVIFLPRDLARQIVLHEAAHLKHLDHSHRFYDELFSYEGSSREAEKAVKKGNQFVPAWFHIV